MSKTQPPIVNVAGNGLTPKEYSEPILSVLMQQQKAILPNGKMAFFNLTRL